MDTFTYPKTSLLPLRCPRCGEQMPRATVPITLFVASIPLAYIGGTLDGRAVVGDRSGRRLRWSARAPPSAYGHVSAHSRESRGLGPEAT